jgi:hypothetical protein
MSKVGGGRNFGYGKRLDWAAKNALHDRYGSGHYSTRASHEARWKTFVQFLKTECGIKDARHIDRAVIKHYAQYLQRQVQSQQLAVAYAQNLLSTVNVVLAIMRKDTQLSVSPSKAVGERSNVRTRVPETLAHRARTDSHPHSTDAPPFRAVQNSPLENIKNGLDRKGERPLSLLVSLCRTFGLRFKEASLINAKTALRQAQRYHRINITEGTKGGRGKQVERWVPATSDDIALLKAAAKEQGSNQNLIPDKYNYIQWRNHAYSQWRLATKAFGIKGFHGLRAAYACERYRQITGADAPVIAGTRMVEKSLDHQARRIIAVALGHNRIDILVSYIGSAK